MLCQQCHERPATIHFCQIVGKGPATQDLCEVCGQEFVDMPWISNEVPISKSVDLDWFAASKQHGSPIADLWLFLVDKMIADDPRYTKDAYEFVRDGLDRAMMKCFRESATKPFPKPFHVSGIQLLEALRELAVEKYSKQAKATLNGWGICKCEDFGEIVFNMVEAGLLAKQETDTKADFQGGYDFNTAFPS